MILNRLIIPEHNDLSFVLRHTENGEKFVLPESCRYYMIISKPYEPFEKVFFNETDSENFCFPIEIPVGEYIFEVGMIDGNSHRRVILPALDERLRPLNQLFVLRRLEK